MIKGEINNEILIRLCLKGDRQAQKMLFDQYYDTMYSVSYRIVQDQEDTQDVLQEAFIRVFSKIAHVKDPEHIGGWIRSIVVNQSINFLRKNRKIEFNGSMVDAPEEEAEDNRIFSISPEQVMTEVQKLPEGCRTVLILYLVENFKQNDIAEMCGISVSTVKSQYQRAKSILRQNLENFLHEN